LLERAAMCVVAGVLSVALGLGERSGWWRGDRIVGTSCAGAGDGITLPELCLAVAGAGIRCPGGLERLLDVDGPAFAAKPAIALATAPPPRTGAILTLRNDGVSASSTSLLPSHASAPGSLTVPAPSVSRISSSVTSIGARYATAPDSFHARIWPQTRPVALSKTQVPESPGIPMPPLRTQTRDVVRRLGNRTRARPRMQPVERPDVRPRAWTERPDRFVQGAMSRG